MDGRRDIAVGPGTDRSPAWAPDGRTIAFVSNRDGDDELFVVSPAGGRPRQLTNNRRVDDTDPAWSRSGTLAFVSTDAFDAEFLFVRDLRGRERFLLEGDDVCCPAWSPDGSRLELSIDGDIVIVDRNGRGRRLVARAGDNAGPTWSPDGRSIAFQSDRSDGEAVFVAPATGGPPRFLAAGKTPAWSPDGRWIAVARGDIDELDASIYVVSADGKREQRVPLASPAGDPSWAPRP